MFNSKTHFQQVPLEFVRKMVEDQIQREAITEHYQGIEKVTRNEPLSPVKGKSVASPVALAQVESRN